MKIIIYKNEADLTFYNYNMMVPKSFLILFSAYGEIGLKHSKKSEESFVWGKNPIDVECSTTCNIFKSGRSN